MHVGLIMRKDLVTVPPDTSLVKARDLINEKLIDHLLVVDKDGKLVGIVSDRDLKQAWASPATTLSAHELNYLLKQLNVETIMVKKIMTVTPGTTIERAGPHHARKQDQCTARHGERRAGRHYYNDRCHGCVA